MASISPRHGPAIAGFARGWDEGGRQSRLEEEAAREREIAPIRKRALETRATAEEEALDRSRRMAPLEERLTRLNLESAEQKKEAQDMVLKAQKNRTKLTQGVSEAMVSGDANAVARALMEVNDRFTDLSATRLEDGSIEFKGKVDGKDFTYGFKASKFPDGTEVTPDEGMAIFMHKYMDPIAQTDKELERRFGLRKEEIKQEGALKREKIKEGVAKSRLDAADARVDQREKGKAKSSARSLVNAQFRQGGTLQTLLTQGANSEPEIAGRAHVIAEQMIDQAWGSDEGMTASEAAQTAAVQVRTAHSKAKEQAIKAADGLAKGNVLGKPINPRDRKQVEEAARAGDGNARLLLAAESAVQKHFGPETWNGILRALPTGRR